MPRIAKRKLSRRYLDLTEPVRSILNDWASREGRGQIPNIEYILKCAAAMYQADPTGTTVQFVNANNVPLQQPASRQDN